MNSTPGIIGYERVTDKFIEASQALDFYESNKQFLPFLPTTPSRVLDAGTGAGQNAATLARLGHSLVAVEPMPAFLNAARTTYTDLGITWFADSLPLLKMLGDAPNQFDFILVQGVWHHLDEAEREQAMARCSMLLDDGGVCAISLRNGPAGAGIHVFPTDGKQTATLAEQHGLEVLLHLENQPSIMKNKPDVIWAHMVFRK
ncbi:MAG: class I SAM-dependent methyltransferase [Pseudomonadota bacterium]